MFCPSCNAPNREDAKFCKSCGLRFEAAKATQPENVSGASEQPASPVSAPTASHDPEMTQLDSDATLLSEQPWDEPEDIALAPTLVLSHEQLEQMMARRSRAGLPNVEEATQAAPLASAKNAATHPADMPTMIMSVNDEMPTLVSGEASNSLADMPTMMMPEAEQDHEQDTLAAPSPFDSAPAITLEENAEQKEATDTMSEQPVSQADTPDQPVVAEGEAGLLSVGTLLAGRYEITQVIQESDAEHTYRVTDRQGYQHCWNCGTEENAEGNEFCDNCGAELLNVPYILHAYPASGQASGETVLQGTIVNTFIEQGRTYAVEQPALNQSSFPNGVHLLAAGGSDAGDVRRSEPNEDSVLVLQLQRIHESNSAPTGVFIVADGMGGHDYGQVASRMATNTIAERMTRELLGAPLQTERSEEKVAPAEEDDLVGLLRNSIEEANLALCQKNQREKTDMGCTLTGCMVIGEHAYIANVGDSRTYMIRGGQIYKLTTDHSLVGQLVAGGLIEPDDVYTHPQRSQIFRSLGDKPNVQVDIFKQQLLPGDILLSCSDGLWEMVRDPQIESILNAAPDPQTACMQLIEMANTNGGEDNVSVIVVFAR